MFGVDVWHKFISHKLSELVWEDVPGDGTKPPYQEATIGGYGDDGEESINSWYLPVLYSDHLVSVSIRKYPRRYFLAVVISPDPESDDELMLGEDDPFLAFVEPIVSCILFKVDHAEFEENFADYLGKLYDWLEKADIDAIHLNATLKGMRNAT